MKNIYPKNCLQFKPNCTKGGNCIVIPFQRWFPFKLDLCGRHSDERWELSPALSSVSYLAKPNWVISEGY